jgi:hypothetical protein
MSPSLTRRSATSRWSSRTTRCIRTCRCSRTWPTAAHSPLVPWRDHNKSRAIHNAVES